jgi:hypothetical protein
MVCWFTLPIGDALHPDGTISGQCPFHWISYECFEALLDYCCEQCVPLRAQGQRYGLDVMILWSNSCTYALHMVCNLCVMFVQVTTHFPRHFKSTSLQALASSMTASMECCLCIGCIYHRLLWTISGSFLLPSILCYHQWTADFTSGSLWFGIHGWSPTLRRLKFYIEIIQLPRQLPLVWCFFTANT